MARIAGVNIPQNKIVQVGLTYIHGIGQKFSKQIILKKIGVVGQQKLKSAKVLVLGMGGLGCPLSIYLASLGIGTIGIVDDEKWSYQI